jgi:hypothetical protein
MSTKEVDDCPDLQPCKCGCAMADAMVIVNNEWMCASCISNKIKLLEGKIRLLEKKNKEREDCEDCPVAKRSLVNVDYTAVDNVNRKQIQRLLEEWQRNANYKVMPENNMNIEFSVTSKTEEDA